MRSVILASLSFLIITYSCNSNNQDKEPIILLNSANWIGDGSVTISSDSIMFKNDPAPLFRKEFIVDTDIESANLYITAAGYYIASINGNRVGKSELDPAWTHYGKRLYYSEFDITSDIRPGKNCLGVSTGNGFYNPLPLKMWGGRNIRDALPVGRPVFIALLSIKTVSGEIINIPSDASWRFTYGPRIKNSVYLGEFYDARKEITDWNLPGFNDTSWHFAEISEGPGGKLQSAFFPPVEVTETITPVEISSPGKEVYIADMGVNFTGDYRIRLKGNKGDTIVFRFGERIYENGELNPMTTVAGQIKRKGMGGAGSPDIAWQTDTYIFGDKTDIWYNPEFTFHTYRYMEISGLKYKPEPNDIQGLFFHTNVSDRNNFECSSELLNSIQEAAVRTFKANLISVQSDCPAREKFGYGGDLNAISESFIYNFDMHSFYRKTIYDWLDAINDSVFIDTAPYVGIRYCGLSWESAMLTTQYYLYLYYNDIEIIKELYERDKLWMEKVKKIHPEGIVDKGLADHEALEKGPVELTGTTHYLLCAEIMEKFAGIMKDTEAEYEYRELALDLKKKIKKLFWEKQITEQINKQTLYASLLYYDILSEEEKTLATDSLKMALKNGPAGHITGGIFGTKYILEASSESDISETIFDIVNSKIYPGWGYMIDKGATTIWETWKESDNTYSNCHPMFGSVSEWFYRWLGGIKPDPQNPGFKKFYISPYIPEELNYVNCNYFSPYGEIISNWIRLEAGRIKFEIAVPDSSTAVFILAEPEISRIQVETLINNTYTRTGTFSSVSDGLELSAGKYSISLTIDELD